MTAGTLERVTAILVEHFGTEKADRITPAATMSDLGGDSLDVVELELACEESFGFRFADAVGFGTDPTIAHVVETVDQLAASAQDQVEI